MVSSPASASTPRKRFLPPIGLAVRTDDALADGVGEVLGLAQRALRARRRDVDRVVGAVRVEDARHALAERVVDAVRRGRCRRRTGSATRSSTASTSTPGTRDSTAGAISSCSVRSLANVVLIGLCSFNKNGRGAPIS